MRTVAFGQIDGETVLASGGDERAVDLRDPSTGEMLRDPLIGHSRAVTSVAFAQNSGGQPLLASGSLDGTVRIWNLTTGEALGTRRERAPAVNAVTFGRMPGGQFRLFSGHADRDVRQWDPLTGERADYPLEHQSGFLTSVAFAELEVGHVVLACGNNDGSILLWRANADNTWRRDGHLKGHTASVTGLVFGAFCDDKVYLNSSSDDGTVRLWDPLGGKECERFESHTGPVKALAFGRLSGGSEVLVSGSWDCTVRLWNPFAKPALDPSIIPIVGVGPSAIALHDGQIVVAGSRGMLSITLA